MIGCFKNQNFIKYNKSEMGEMVSELKTKLQNDKVVLGLSGGVDSTVAAVLLHQAIGKNLYCIF